MIFNTRLEELEYLKNKVYFSNLDDQVKALLLEMIEKELQEARVNDYVERLRRR